MTASSIIFYLLALLTLVSAFASVTTRHIFRAAIYLLFSLIGIAGIYFWLSYDFIAAVQIVVYVGGIVVLIIFSIFLTQQAGEALPKQRLGRNLFAALAAFSGYALLMLQIANHAFPLKQIPATDHSVESIGKQLINIEQTGMALPFEVISMLLLAAMVGCIVVAMRIPEINHENKNEAV